MLSVLSFLAFVLLIFSMLLKSPQGALLCRCLPELQLAGRAPSEWQSAGARQGVNTAALPLTNPPFLNRRSFTALLLCLLGRKIPKHYPSPYGNPFLSPTCPLKMKYSTDISGLWQELFMGVFDPIVLYPKLLTTLPVLGERGQKEGMNVIHHLFRIEEQTRDTKFCSLRTGEKEKAHKESQELVKHFNSSSHVI